MKNTNNSICGYCNPTKVLPSSYPNQISIIEGIIRVSAFCDDFSDCFSKEKLASFIIGYLDPMIECNPLTNENGEEKHTVFNAFHSEMIATYNSDMSFCKVFGEEDGICVMFRLQFNMEIGCFLSIPIEFLEKLIKIEKNSYIHLHSSKDGVVTLDEMKNYNWLMDEEPNHEEEIRKIYEDFVNGNYELWYENKTINKVAELKHN